MNLSKRVFKAGIWVSIAFACSRLFGLLRLTVLTNYLLPTDFGLITLVTLVVSSMWVLSDTGTAAALIQKPDPQPHFLHTIWHMNWMRGLMLAALTWVTAPYVAMFFEHDALETLLRWAAIIPLLHGFESIGMVLLKKDINFRQRAYLDFTRESVQTIVSICLVIYWAASAEAILWGIIAGVFAATFVSYFFHAYRPALRFHKTSAVEIWKYGGHLMGAGILIFAMTNLDDALVGKMLGVEQLGFYGVAFTLTGILTSQLVQVFNAVMFPALSEIQSDSERVRRILGLSVRLMSGVLTPVICFVALFPNALIEFFLGQVWVPVASVLLILLCMGWVRGIATVFGPILLARKKTALIHKMKWYEFALFITTIVPAISWFDIEGAALVLLLVYCLSLVLHIRAVNAEISTGFHEFVILILHGVLPAGIAFICAKGMFYFIGDVPLILLGSVFLSIWLVLVWLREKHFIVQLVDMVKQK